ncbi:MAG: Ig-like domain-containing protein [Thaumarchaeota archaeon]|nr:Ig-like domain-containing protein [Nitrososphaerota archaeon]
MAIALLVISPVVYPLAGNAPLDRASGSVPMKVSISLAQPPLSTVLDTLVLWATVTAGGQPVPNALVTFNDTFVSAFYGNTAMTNSSGVALTELYFINPNRFNDTITAVATASGYSPGNGSVVVYVFQLSNQQLAVTATIVNDGASGGSSEVIQGYVGTVYSSSTKWSGFITGLQDATVVLSDSIGSTFPKTVTTNSAGFYSANFTLGKPTTSVADIIAVNCSGLDYNGSESTFELAVGPYGAKSLTVNLDSIYPSTYSTLMNSVTIQAHVSAGGTPVPGATVTFSDTLGAIFTDEIGTTDASGTATATVQYVLQSAGLDLFTVQASVSGLSPDAASNTLSVRPLGNKQLSVTESVRSATPAAGTTDMVFGEVGWVGSSVGYAWSPMQNGVSGTTVVISDSRGLFAPVTVATNAAGGFSGTFMLPNTFEGVDVIEASASDAGYRGSATSTYIVVGPSQGPTTSNTTASASTSATSSQSTTNEAAGPGPTQVRNATLASSTVDNETTESTSKGGMSALWPGSAIVLLAVAAVAIGTLLVYRVTKIGPEGRRVP